MRGTARTGRRGTAAPIAAAVALLPACFGLGACGGQKGVTPVTVWRELSGVTDAARPTPPGLDRPFPSLASVPPRPDRPPPEVRDAITAALAADRGRSREPVALRAAPGAGQAAVPVPAGMAAGPPPRPALAAAPNVPWAEGGAPAPRDRGTPAAAAPASQAPAARPPAPEVPDAAPAPPSPDLLGAPPPPSPDLLAPAPPARR